ncbi:cytochrome P450 [Crepidotus variabilis]|uniref:Cytochrome P450 n=1 Tax=Crepidotus variabilis TaxID=179855 RepID=A0A9P6EDA7_9AGAR|nr:cytochrome P450 [Crepidotus variabilis]
MGQPLIILNSCDIMDEFDKKGAIYSDRPVLEMGGELVGYAESLVLMRYGPRFRTYRKHFSRYIGPNKPIQSLHPLVEQESRKFLRRTLENHKNLSGNLRKLAGGIILGLAYGYEVQDGDDQFINLIEQANNNFNKASVPGAYLVDVIPALKHLPDWVPGTSFLKLARDWRRDTEAMADVPYAFTKKQVAAGTAVPSFVSTGLEDEASRSSEYIRDLKWTAASLYGGGADTTVSSEYAFFLAMVLFPEVQKKAQAELDVVIGNDRLPTIADMPRLPYVNAVVTEVLRWNSVAPLGVPHTAMEDGYINGYFVPKGTILIANLWAMLHDPEIYPDPFVFNPERHLGPEPQRDVRRVCFGYGRRICPGMHLAEVSVYSLVSTSLAVFNMEKALDGNGVPMTPVHENTNGIISYPKPFDCAIKPRSEKALALITESHI